MENMFRELTLEAPCKLVPEEAYQIWGRVGYAGLRDVEKILKFASERPDQKLGYPLQSLIENYCRKIRIDEGMLQIIAIPESRNISGLRQKLATLLNPKLD
jgi:hypothetical protein